MRFIHDVGNYFLMLRRMFVRPDRIHMYWLELLRQMMDIGFGSLVIVLICSFFIGAVTAVQSAYQLAGTVLVPPYYLGLIVRNTTILGLAPTFTCLILAGKVGSNIASELGTMRISEQIDALEIMGVPTETYLILPRVLAAIMTVPMLVIVSAFVGIGGGLLAGSLTGYASTAEFVYGLLAFFDVYDVTMMLIKAVTFGFIIATISCFKGFYILGGSIEVGRASTQAVVLSCIFVLLADYILAELLL